MKKIIALMLIIGTASIAAYNVFPVFPDSKVKSNWGNSSWGSSRWNGTNNICDSLENISKLEW